MKSVLIGLVCGLVCWPALAYDRRQFDEIDAILERQRQDDVEYERKRQMNELIDLQRRLLREQQDNSERTRWR